MIIEFFFLIIIFIIIIILLLIFIKLKLYNTRSVKENYKIHDKESIKKKYNLYNVFNGKKWHDYRLGDIIRGTAGDDIGKVDERFPETIGSLYYLNTQLNNNIKLLNRIIRYPQFYVHKSPENTCSLHTRLGDVLGGELANNKFYNHPISYYENHVIPRLNHHNIKKVTIVGGAHWDGNTEKSIDHIVNIIELFLKYDIIIETVRLGQSPDEDFVFMSTSKYFIQGGGGFSIVVSMMVLENKGIVLNTW